MSWDSYTTIPGAYFLLCNFYDMSDKMPDRGNLPQ